jgi:hypothetical protein
MLDLVYPLLISFVRLFLFFVYYFQNPQFIRKILILFGSMLESIKFSFFFFFFTIFLESFMFELFVNIYIYIYIYIFFLPYS